ncbi:MAG: hypothetical protein ACI9N1_002689, partial [Flavobacteriales bacterium]
LLLVLFCFVNILSQDISEVEKEVKSFLDSVRI